MTPPAAPAPLPPWEETLAETIAWDRAWDRYDNDSNDSNDNEE